MSDVPKVHLFYSFCYSSKTSSLHKSLRSFQREIENQKKKKKNTLLARATFLQPTKIPNQLASKTEWLWELRNQSPSKVRTINKMKSITPASSSSSFPTRLASLPTSNKSMKMFQSFLFQVKRTVETPLLLSLVSLSLVCIQYNF